MFYTDSHAYKYYKTGHFMSLWNGLVTKKVLVKPDVVYCPCKRKFVLQLLEVRRTHSYLKSVEKLHQLLL